jgi:hypothetical protein
MCRPRAWRRKVEGDSVKPGLATFKASEALTTRPALGSFSMTATGSQASASSLRINKLLQTRSRRCGTPYRARCTLRTCLGLGDRLPFSATPCRSGSRRIARHSSISNAFKRKAPRWPHREARCRAARPPHFRARRSTRKGWNLHGGRCRFEGPPTLMQINRALCGGSNGARQSALACIYDCRYLSMSNYRPERRPLVRARR